MKIDVVVPWVDGNDAALNARRMKYGNETLFRQVNVAGGTRYANVGEIFWCVASLNRFAPWINRIYIVTDAQDPDLGPFLEEHFPEGHIPVEIVDHKDIFRGYEEYLPTFNSISIESMCWRIPGLSEQYIYFNDDLILSAPAEPSDFFTENGGIIARVSWFSLPFMRLIRFLKPKKRGIKPHSFKWTMAQAAMALGEKWRFMKLYHTPRGLLKSYFETFFAEHPELLIRNIRHKFRDNDHYSVNELQYMGLYRQGKCRVMPAKGYVFYLEPKKKPNYVANKMRVLNDGDYRCCCFNSLDQASEQDRKMIISWIENRLGL